MTVRAAMAWSGELQRRPGREAPCGRRRTRHAGTQHLGRRRRPSRRTRAGQPAPLVTRRGRGAQGLRGALEAAMRIKGLLEMMFDVLSGWIAEFIADMEARPCLLKKIRMRVRCGWVPGGRAWRGSGARRYTRCRTCDEAHRPRPCRAVMPGHFMRHMSVQPQAHAAGTKSSHKRPCGAYKPLVLPRQRRLACAMRAGARAGSRAPQKLEGSVGSFTVDFSP